MGERIRNTRHELEIRTASSGLVRVLGIRLLSDRPGIVYSAFGVVGARAPLLLRAREELFAGELRLVEPPLVILGFGTNESGERGFDPALYTRQFQEVLARIRRATPRATVLVVAPPDRDAKDRGGSYRPLAARAVVADCQRHAAEAAGALYFDLGLAMGGLGSMKRWAEGLGGVAMPEGPLVQPDHVHFTPAGYARLSRFLIVDLFTRLNEARRSDGFRAFLASEEASAELRLAAKSPIEIPPESTIASASAARRGRVPNALEAGSVESGIRSFRDANGRIVLTNGALPTRRAELGKGKWQH